MRITSRPSFFAFVYELRVHSWFVRGISGRILIVKETTSNTKRAYPPTSYTTEISEKGDHFGWIISGKRRKLSAAAIYYEVPIWSTTTANFTSLNPKKTPFALELLWNVLIYKLDCQAGLFFFPRLFARNVFINLNNNSCKPRENEEKTFNPAFHMYDQMILLPTTPMSGFSFQNFKFSKFQKNKISGPSWLWHRSWRKLC